MVSSVRSKHDLSSKVIAGDLVSKLSLETVLDAELTYNITGSM